MKYTLRDESLPHQIQIIKTDGHSDVVVTCNCWMPKRVIMGPARTPDEAWQHYNDPDKHNGHVEPFEVTGRHGGGTK